MIRSLSSPSLVTFLSHLSYVTEPFFFLSYSCGYLPKEWHLRREVVFVFMTLCCELGQMGGVLREMTANNSKPFEMTAWIATH